MSDAEFKIEDYLVERVAAVGGEVRKVKWPGHTKAPDRLVGVKGRVVGLRAMSLSRHALVELKKPGGAYTFPKNAHERGQAREHARLREIGFDVFVIDSKPDVDQLIAWLRR